MTAGDVVFVVLSEKERERETDGCGVVNCTLELTTMLAFARQLTVPMTHLSPSAAGPYRDLQCSRQIILFFRPWFQG